MTIRKRLIKFLNARLSHKYGSARGFFKLIIHLILNFFGWYKKYKNIDWDKVERLVFVCKGNICRSAFAEAVARFENIEAVSCGIDTDDGKLAYKMAIDMAPNKGYSLYEHKTTKITSLEIKEGDLFIAMEPYQATFLKEFLNDDCMLTLLGLWCPPYSPYIHDPYGNSDNYISICFEYIKKSVIGVTSRINNAQYH